MQISNGRTYGNEEKSEVPRNSSPTFLRNPLEKLVMKPYLVWFFWFSCQLLVGKEGTRGILIGVLDVENGKQNGSHHVLMELCKGYRSDPYPNSHFPLTLNPKPLNPIKPLNPKPLNPQPLNPKPLNPKP